MGPDGTYNGMTHFHMAKYARDSKNPRMLDALKKSYNFFNHTVAPEPNGSMLGASNFGHRTARSFVQEQWGGAKGIVDLPEVALWTKPTKSGAVWPAAEGESFTRNLGNQLIAVKRPGYYTAVYVGKPAGVPHYINGKEGFRSPLPNDAENKGGAVDFRKVTPYLGGGLSLFWTPSYGSSILAMNWAPTTHHGLIATQADGKRYWEDYFATNYQLSSDNSALAITGKIEGQPIKYERRYEFGNDSIKVLLSIEAIEDVKLARFHENIPVVVGTVKKNGADIAIPGEAEGRATAKSFSISNASGKGVGIELDAPRELRIFRNGLKGRYMQVGRVEIVLPANMLKGEKTDFSYTIRPK